MLTHHQLIKQQNALVTRQDQRREATMFQQELKAKKKDLTERGYYELAAMVTNFDIAIFSYMQGIAA